MKTAVLVIDVQRGLCDDPPRPHEAEAVMQRINALTGRARASGVPVAFIQHENAVDLEFDSERWQLASALDTDSRDAKIRKTTPDSFHKTDLQAVLTAHGIEDLIVCGMHTEFCVDTTTRRALALGYPVVLVADAHTSAGNAVLSPMQVIQHHNDTLTHISSFGPRVTAVTTEDLRIGT